MPGIASLCLEALAMMDELVLGDVFTWVFELALGFFLWGSVGVPFDSDLMS